MKKINKLFLLLILVSTILSATEHSYSFIGIQTDYSKIDNHSVQSIGLKYGQQERNYRTSIAYNYGSKHDFTYQTLMVQMDMGIFERAFKNSPFKPYIGISAGYMQEEDESLSKNSNGFLYGANTGITYIANDNFDFDLGYRYLRTHQLETVDEINNINLSMHYFY